MSVLVSVRCMCLGPVVGSSLISGWAEPNNVAVRVVASGTPAVLRFLGALG